MGGTSSDSREQSCRADRIAGCQARTLPQAVPADTVPCGESREDNRFGRSPTENRRAARPLLLHVTMRTKRERWAEGSSEGRARPIVVGCRRLDRDEFGPSARVSGRPVLRRPHESRKNKGLGMCGERVKRTSATIGPRPFRPFPEFPTRAGTKLVPTDSRRTAENSPV